jgi:hypothetical protein
MVVSTHRRAKRGQRAGIGEERRAYGQTRLRPDCFASYRRLSAAS